MTQKTEIEKKLKRVQWIRTVINHHLDDVEKILNDAKSICSQQPQKCDGVPKYDEWDSYRDVLCNILTEKDYPDAFSSKVDKLLYDMSKHHIPRVEAKGVIDKLIPYMTHKKTVDYMNEKLDFFYPNSQSPKSMSPMRRKLLDEIEILEKDGVFDDDLGMP